MQSPQLHTLSHLSPLAAVHLTHSPTPQACAPQPAHLDAHPCTDRLPRRRTRPHARTRTHTRTHARQTMASPCLRWRAPSARAASYLGGRVNYSVESRERRSRSAHAGFLAPPISWLSSLHVLCALRVVRACHSWAPWWARGDWGWYFTNIILIHLHFIDVSTSK